MSASSGKLFLRVLLFGYSWRASYLSKEILLESLLMHVMFCEMSMTLMVFVFIRRFWSSLGYSFHKNDEETLGLWVQIT